MFSKHNNNNKKKWCSKEEAERERERRMSVPLRLRIIWAEHKVWTMKDKVLMDECFVFLYSLGVDKGYSHCDTCFHACDLGVAKTPQTLPSKILCHDNHNVMSHI